VALFPTILSQKIYRFENQEPFLSANIVLNVEMPQVTYIDEVEVNISGMIIKLDDEFLGYILNMMFDLLQLLKTNFTGVHPIFQPPEIKEEEQPE